jgi:hypothetical protein
MDIRADRYNDQVRDDGRLITAAVRGAADVQRRLERARKAFTTRRVEFSLCRRLLSEGQPRPGDLVLARIESVGQHQRIELHSGRRSKLYEGDEIVVAYGARYAPDQFHARVPDNLEPCDLVAGGGVAGEVTARHARMGRPTRLVPIGLLADRDGRVLNLEQFAAGHAPPTQSPTVIVVAGTSMNAGKTTTAASLIRGLTLAGLRVGAGKLTGTGSGGDVWSMTDAGAITVLDFTDAGHATTAGATLSQLQDIAQSLIAGLAEAGADILVLEVADGLFQAETAALMSSPAFLDHVDGVLFAAGEAMGAAAGVDWMRQRGAPVLAISGLVSASPLGREEAEAATGLPVATISDLTDPLTAPRLCFAAATGFERLAALS